MALSAKKFPAAGAGLFGLVLILVIIQFARGCHKKAEAYKPLLRPFWCEACEQEFMAPWREISAACPNCRQESSIIRHHYVCEDCAERFLAYDLDYATAEMRLRGQQWSLPIYPLPEFPCPKCGSAKTALEKYHKQ